VSLEGDRDGWDRTERAPKCAWHAG